MCPNRELVSAWLDGEVPEPWNGELSRHIALCESCANSERELRAVRDALAMDCDRMGERLSERESLDRLRARVESTLGMRRASRDKSVERAPSLWSRRFLVPAPALLAALLAVAILSGGTILVAKRNAELLVAASAAIGAPAFPETAALAMPASAEASAVDSTGASTGALTVGDTMQSVIDYLDKQGGPTKITIEFPSSREFGGEGRPVILREADFDAGAKR